MKYVYILKSQKNPEKKYVGVTGNLRRRLQEHNLKDSEYTRQFAPWRLETYLAFSNEEKALAFERFLKKGGGWRFATRRLI